MDISSTGAEHHISPLNTRANGFHFCFISIHEVGMFIDEQNKTEQMMMMIQQSR